MKQHNIERIIDSVDKLPTLPVIYTKLTNILEQSNATINKIANIISEDQTIAAKVLKIVNSAFYGFPKKIASLQRAVVILGLKEIKNLVLATSTLKMFEQLQPGDELDMKSFWEHSIGCATSAKVLAEAAYLRNPEDVFTGGLLHDIGKLVHALYLPQEFSSVVADIRDTGMPMFESEKRIIGFTHDQTGRILAEKWGFPEEVTNMITEHHLNHEPSNLTKEVAAVHIGNILCIAFSLGSGGEKRVPIANQKAWEILGLRLGTLESITGRIIKLFREAISILEL